MKKNKVTEKHYKLFQRCVKKWIGIYGLHDWELSVVWEQTCSDSMAKCEADLEQKMATIKLNTDWGKTKVTAEELDRTAYHEVLELLLMPLRFLVLHTNPNQQIHDVIARIENAVWDERLKVNERKVLK